MDDNIILRLHNGCTNYITHTLRWLCYHYCYIVLVNRFLSKGINYTHLN